MYRNQSSVHLKARKTQQGFLMPLAIFILVVMGLLALTVARTTSQTSLASSQEAITLQLSFQVKVDEGKTNCKLNVRKSWIYFNYKGLTMNSLQYYLFCINCMHKTCTFYRLINHYTCPLLCNFFDGVIFAHCKVSLLF